MQESNSLPVAVIGKNGEVRWHFMWQDNPRIVKPNYKGKVQYLKNHSGCRPYVDYTKTTKQRWFYTDWRCSPGEIYLNDEEEAFGLEHRDYMIIEPHIKKNASCNKLWGFRRSQAVVNMYDGNFAQMGPPGTRWLDNVTKIITPDFRQACAVISKATCYVGIEGGLHHAAAAFNIPGVVVFGGMTSPRNTGYDIHINITRDDGKSPCGWRIPCTHCHIAMSSITPELVVDALRSLEQ